IRQLPDRTSTDGGLGYADRSGSPPNVALRPTQPSVRRASASWHLCSHYKVQEDTSSRSSESPLQNEHKCQPISWLRFWPEVHVSISSLPYFPRNCWRL